MFFQLTLSTELTLVPQFFGKNIERLLHDRLRETHEGRFMGENGFVIAILSISPTWKNTGVLDDTTGAAHYRVEYTALVYRPFKGVVVDAIVTNVSEHGFFCSMGCAKAFVSRKGLPSYFGAFNMERSSFISDDKTLEIKKNTAVRLRLLETKIELTEIDSIGTIKEDFLGPTEATTGMTL
jgi:DNA-directed RNA polymerase II subunit RPB7